MLDWLAIIFIIMALLFMLLGIDKFRDKDYLWSFIFTLISIVMWYILAASILETETPYQLYNATSGNIETGISIYTSKVAPEMVYFFYMMASINIIFMVLQVFVAVGSIFKRKRELS